MKKKLLIIIPVTLIVIAGVAFAYLFTHGLSGMMPQEINSTGRIKVACVGDSVTYGHGIKNWTKNNYPAVLAELLGKNYTVQNFGNSGTTVQDTADQPYTATKQYKLSLNEFNPDIIIFMLGSNDSKPKNWKGEEAFKKAASALIDRYLKTGAKLYIGIPPEAFYVKEGKELTSFEISPTNVDTIAKIMKQLAKEKELETIDIHSLTEQHPEYFLSDCVHPDADGAKAIAETVFKAIVH